MNRGSDAGTRSDFPTYLTVTLLAPNKIVRRVPSAFVSPILM